MQSLFFAPIVVGFIEQFISLQNEPVNPGLPVGAGFAVIIVALSRFWYFILELMNKK